MKRLQLLSPSRRKKREINLPTCQVSYTPPSGAPIIVYTGISTLYNCNCYRYTAHEEPPAGEVVYSVVDKSKKKKAQPTAGTI